MSTEIFYFSGTGNTLHVARELQKRIPETALTPIVSLLDKESNQTHTEVVGFVFPQYASTLPKIVARFARTLDVASAAYIFAVATRGGTDCLAFQELDEILAASGRRLDSFFVLNMPSGSQPLVSTYATRITKENISRLESEMLKRLNVISQTILAREENRSEDLRGIVPIPRSLAPFMPLIDALQPLLLRFGKRAESTFGFYYDDRCTGCRVCEGVCPAQRVKMVAERPVWRKEVKCYGCFACLNYCPLQSVQIKSTWYLKSYTRVNGRYHHPEITAKDIAEQKAVS
jgi:NAD-dependent dihydropyrimidine dehydrogenase PreA subunit